MKIFPQNVYSFKLINENDALERLKRRTEISNNLTSRRTEKSFIGSINGNNFKLITSEIGKGALTVMSGKINNKDGIVITEINKAFRIMFIVICCFPFIAVLTQAFSNSKDFSPIFFLIALLQVLFFRFVLGLIFKNLSKQSINRLSDVLDVEYMTKNE